jgi:hypothetical protein
MADTSEDTPVTTFSSDKEALTDLLQSIHKGKTQLPDFQRGWVWDDEHIRGLLASVTMSFPIGAVMMLQSGGKNVRFKPRLIEGVELVRSRIRRGPLRASHLAHPDTAILLHLSS